MKMKLAISKQNSRNLAFSELVLSRKFSSAWTFNLEDANTDIVLRYILQNCRKDVHLSSCSILIKVWWRIWILRQKRKSPCYRYFQSNLRPASWTSWHKQSCNRAWFITIWSWSESCKGRKRRFNAKNIGNNMMLYNTSKQVKINKISPKLAAILSCREDPWTPNQKEKFKQRVKEKLKCVRFIKVKDYTKKLLSNCKTRDGPCSSVMS